MMVGQQLAKHVKTVNVAILSDSKFVVSLNQWRLWGEKTPINWISLYVMVGSNPLKKIQIGHIFKDDHKTDVLSKLAS